MPEVTSKEITDIAQYYCDSYFNSIVHPRGRWIILWGMFKPLIRELAIFGLSLWYCQSKAIGVTGSKRNACWYLGVAWSCTSGGYAQNDCSTGSEAGEICGPEKWTGHMCTGGISPCRNNPCAAGSFPLAMCTGGTTPSWDSLGIRAIHCQELGSVPFNWFATLLILAS